MVAARQQINENYRKNKDEKPEKVEELIKLAEGVDIELKSRVVQCREISDGVYGKVCPNEFPVGMSNVSRFLQRLLLGTKYNDWTMFRMTIMP